MGWINSPVLGAGLGIVFLGLMFGVPNLDTVLVDLTKIRDPAIQIIQLGFFTIGLYFFLQGGEQV
jgi:hypothetical protein